MKIALAQARKGMGKVWPNPMVGCVVVRGGEIVGKGYHEYFGGLHAERNALDEAGKRAFGSTLYSTLEPCRHFGKTPPCTEAILEAGVSRVVVAVRDPNPKMNGKGLEWLKRKSIRITEGILRQGAARLNAAYIKKRHSGEVRVIAKFAMSLDGKAATRTGDSKWISSRASREFVHRLRKEVDAVLVGANTAKRDDPALTTHGKGRNPVRILIDPGLDVPLSRRLFDGSAPTIVFHSSGAKERKILALRKKRIAVVQLRQKKGIMRFEDIIAKLKAYSLTRILIEGGGETLAAALEAAVVREMIVFIAPKIVGGRSAITPVEGLGVAMVRHAAKLLDTRVRRMGSDLLIRASVARRKQVGGR